MDLTPAVRTTDFLARQSRNPTNPISSRITNTKPSLPAETLHCARRALCLAVLFCLWPGAFAFGQTSPKSLSISTNEALLPELPCDKSAIHLEAIPFKIVHETYRETDGVDNWELQMINADGSNPVNLTRTPGIDELYPHASPDGTKICFVAEEKRGARGCAMSTT
jgi:hypothetical protein